MKAYFKTAEAISMVKNGKTIQYDMEDGICEIRKSGAKYEFKLTTLKETVTFKGDLKNLIRTLNEKHVRNKVYLK